MKAFEERLAREFPHIRPSSVDAEIMRQEWRAALEWASLNGNCGGYCCGSEIQEELEEE